MSEVIELFPGAMATDTLVPQAVKVTVGSSENAETFTIATFCLSKTIRTFALLTELAQAAGISDVVAAANDSAAAGEFQSAVAPAFVTRALAILPKALANGTPALYRLLGLLVTPNAKLRKMDEEGDDIDGYLLGKGRDLAYEGSNDQIVSLVLKSVQVMGLETITKNLPGLMSLLRAR